MDELIESWVLSLRARNLSPNTIAIYQRAARHLTAHMATDGRRAPTKQAVEAFLAMRAETTKPANVSVEYRALQQFFRWLALEGEGPNVMATMQAPIVPEQPVPVLTMTQLGDLLKTCDGPSFIDRRDHALLRLFADTGARLAEVAGMTPASMDLAGQTVTVIGKGRRERILPIGSRTVAAIDRYKRIRGRHRRSGDPQLWLGHAGPMTPSGIYRALIRRARSIGLDEFYPHQLRHTMAHEWLANGGNEGDLMELAGWRSRSMLTRYGRSAAAARARAAHREIGLGDRL